MKRLFPLIFIAIIPICALAQYPPINATVSSVSKNDQSHVVTGTLTRTAQDSFSYYMHCIVYDVTSGVMEKQVTSTGYLPATPPPPSLQVDCAIGNIEQDGHVYELRVTVKQMPTAYTGTVSATFDISSWANQGPTITLTKVSQADLGVVVNCSATDSDGTVASLKLRWKAEESLTVISNPSNNLAHTYAAAGTYTIYAEAVDNLGKLSVKSISVTVTAPVEPPDPEDPPPDYTSFFEAIIGWIQAYWDSLTDWFEGIWVTITDYWDLMWQPIEGIFGAINGFVYEWWIEFRLAVFGFFSDVAGWFNSLGLAIGNVVTAVGDLVQPLVTAINTAIDDIWQNLNSMLTWVLSYLNEIKTSVIDVGYDVIDQFVSLFEKIVALPGQIWEAILPSQQASDRFSAALDDFKDITYLNFWSAWQAALETPAAALPSLEFQFMNTTVPLLDFQQLATKFNGIRSIMGFVVYFLFAAGLVTRFFPKHQV